MLEMCLPLLKLSHGRGIVLESSRKGEEMSKRPELISIM